MHRQRTTSLVAFTGAGALLVVATFVPWLRSGSTTRSSYDLLGLLSRLGIAPDGVVSLLVRWWPVVPLVVTAAVLLGWWRASTAALVASAVAVAYAAAVGGSVVVASRRVGLSVGIGPWMCVVASITFLVAAAWVAVTHASADGVRTRRAAPSADRS